MQKVNAIHGFLDTVMSVRPPKTVLLLPNDINSRKMNLTFFCQIILPTADKLIVTFSVNRKLNESSNNKIGLDSNALKGLRIQNTYGIVNKV